ncbi:MAG TPA: hypothetical protein VER58_15315 [Thermoanaerobaculia bacterium]|nr:hypothetical protein [Thermoanaerobaculia bacterium]
MQREILPGVSPDGTDPNVVFQSRPVIASARRRAALRDVFDVLLLAGVDALFIRWSHAHIPMLDRAATMLVLAIANAVLIAYVWSVRALPRWRARKLASTWSASERSRFLRF